MSANNSMRVADLDFLSIKENLKTFLRGQSEFTDYDFEGSGMSVLLDVLAYNTYYNSFYLNIAANEAFLDSAQIRQNILSHAKNIGYVPASRQGAVAKINILATPSNTEDTDINYVILDKYTKLLGKDIDGVNYPFVTVNANSAYKSNGSFAFPNVFVRQGEVVTLQYPFGTTRRFEIPSANVDTSTLVVSVQQSSSNTYTTQYSHATDLTEIAANSTVYFIEENENLNYTITFGDNVIGKTPANGSIVNITYLDTVGTVANSISSFTFTDPVAGLFSDNVTVTSVLSSYGGTDKETDEQVRFRAPYAYTAQNRAVTKLDYESLLIKDYNNIESVSVWGGEENDPIVYGKVYLSIKTRGNFALSQIEKDRIKNELITERNVVTVIPEIVDPDYVFIMVHGRVTYDPSKTSKTANQLLTTVRNAIQQYNNEKLNTFKSTFIKSKIQYYIENSDPSITGSDITIYVQKRQDIINNAVRNYTINFAMPLSKGDITDKLYSFPQLTVLDNNGIVRNVFIEEVPESLTGISSVVMIDTGTNYTAAPTVTITGDGTGATAVASVINGRVTKITLTNPGYNYTRATVAITGDGVGASAYALVQANFGSLRTYYYKSNGEKVIINDNAGTVDYVNGKITLDLLFTTAVVPNDFYETNVLTINAVPGDEIIEPLRNRIVTIDMNNAQSIQIEMVPE